MVKKILLSAFRCNPHDVSEAFSAFQWIRQVAKFSHLEVVTAASNQKDLRASNLANTTFEFIASKKYFKNSSLINKAIKLDYFIFNHKLAQISGDLIQSYDLSHHLTPMGIRYPSALARKSKKFIIGPIGGGVPTPTGFKEIYKREPALFQMRRVDKLRLRFDPGLRNTYARSAKILIVGEYLKEMLPSQLHDRCSIMSETGIVASRFMPLESFRTGDMVKLLFVGRIVPTKGLELVLCALSELVGKYAVHLDVIGDGDDMAYCRRLADRLNITGAVDFLGFMPKEEIIKYYQQCDIFVFPSLREASGNVVFEAMSCAKPLIVSNSGGPGQVVRDAFGIRINLESYNQYIHDLAQAIATLIQDPEKRRAMGQNARKEIMKKYDWDAKGEEIKAIYEEVIRQ